MKKTAIRILAAAGIFLLLSGAAHAEDMRALQIKAMKKKAALLEKANQEKERALIEAEAAGVLTSVHINPNRTAFGVKGCRIKPLKYLESMGNLSRAGFSGCESMLKEYPTLDRLHP